MNVPICKVLRQRQYLNLSAMGSISFHWGVPIRTPLGPNIGSVLISLPYSKISNFGLDQIVLIVRVVLTADLVDITCSSISHDRTVQYQRS